jgi:hypothetical protein
VKPNDQPDSIAAPMPNLTPEAVQSEVARILASDKFARSKRLRSLLQFTVNQTLEGHAEMLKEYVIGTEVLHKPDSYDPRRDSLVRVLASRLRMKLKEYYNDGGSEDPLVIEFPKGKYVPRFQHREQLQTEMQKKLRARNAYSRGKFLIARAGEENLTEAAQRFEEAAEVERAWAPPRTEHALARALMAWLGYVRPREAWPTSRSEAEDALDLDEMSSGAHLALGMFDSFYAWRWREAESHFQKAIERDSYSGAGHVWRALGTLIPFGKLREAEEEIAKARELAQAPFLDDLRLLALYLSGRHEEVIAETGMESASPCTPTLGADWKIWLRGCALAASGSLQDAIEVLRGVSHAGSRVAASLGVCYAAAGESERARELKNSLETRRASGAWVPNYERAAIRAALGETDEAMGLLQAAAQEREPWMVFLSLDPRMGPLRANPRFGGFVRRVLSSDEESARVENEEQ